MRDYDAILEDWCLAYDGLEGRVYEDRKGRFRDGSRIITSQLLDAETEPVEGDIVRTMNSAYKLGSKQ